MCQSEQITYSSIKPVLNETARPSWSVMITAYNRSQYLKQAIKSVLDQGYGSDEMQIEVVDDCSTEGDIEAIVKTAGQGRVSYYRQPVNVGIFANWNTCINRAQGRWIHILSDDDEVMPGFYEVYRHHLEKYQCSVAIGQSIFINEHDQWTGISDALQNSGGILENALWLLSKDNPVRTPAIVVAREAYEKVGGFTTDLIYTPDWEMWTRLASSFQVVYTNRPYSLFRVHSHSATSRTVLTGDSVTDSLAASKIIQARFEDPIDRKKVQSSVNNWLGKASFFYSRQLVIEGHYQSALLHAVWAFRLIPSFSSLKNISSTLLRILRSLVRKAIVGDSIQTS
jgi:hypothetical protein